MQTMPCCPVSTLTTEAGCWSCGKPMEVCASTCTCRARTSPCSWPSRTTRWRAEVSLLEPGSQRIDGLDDPALVAAMVRVEVAWMHALVDGGAAKPEHAEAVASAGVFVPLDPAAVEDAGNPVLPFITALRAAVADPDAAKLLHRGLTSQDVLDTALMLLAQDAVARVLAELRVIADALGRLADAHRRSVMAGRTL